MAKKNKLFIIIIFFFVSYLKTECILVPSMLDVFPCGESCLNRVTFLTNLYCTDVVNTRTWSGLQIQETLKIGEHSE